MTSSRAYLALFGAVSVVALTASTGAFAGAFGLREQSAAGQGLSFAGAAAGGAGLGSMFWNPATITDAPGIQSSLVLSAISPYAKLTAQGGSSAGYSLFGSGNSGDIAHDAVLPASYSSWQVNDQIWLGLATNSPFGLATKADRNWAGIAYGSTTKVVSFDATPMIGYKINDMISVAAGVQVMYFKAKYSSGTPNGGAPSTWAIAGLDGDGTGVGYVLGATIKPMVGTEIGLGFRSAVEENLSGSFFGGEAAAPAINARRAAFGLPLLPAATVGALYNHNIKLNVVLPETATLGVKQVVTKDITLLAGVEWTNWSRLKSPAIFDQTTGLPHGLQPNLPLDYKDGWYFSAGAEYQFNPQWTGRVGLAYEVTPIKDASRSTRLPDNDRVWASLGLGYKLNDKLNFDVGYTHIFPMSTKVTMDANNPNYKASLSAAFLNVLNAKVDSHVDILSVGLTYRWDDPVKPAPAALPATPKVKKG
jgi:long-chain fatty acid transport protein